jgi:Acyl-coenzyme A:6-aminopenicillanic acid acyl-transferase
MAIAPGPQAQLIGGVPLLAVIGTPRTMGSHIGSRLKPRLQVLSQYLTDQLITLAHENGQELTPDDVRAFLQPTQATIQRFEPPLWMELEAMAHAAELPISDILLIHGYQDLLSRFGSTVAPQASTFVSVDATHTSDGIPLMAINSQIDPALFPYVTLLRRMPSNGPATLSLTLAGLAPIAGLSEAGIAVAKNELRVQDGVDGIFTTHQINAMLTAPSFSEARHRAQFGPRHGGASIHGLSAKGERFTYELSGQRSVLLNDSLINSPRVHTNHSLHDELSDVVSSPDKNSKNRLELTAAQAIAVSGVTPNLIAEWFGFSGDSGKTTRIEAGPGRESLSAVMMVLNPHARQISLRRTGVRGGLETINL